MIGMTTVRRAVSAMVLVTMVAVALFGQGLAANTSLVDLDRGDGGRAAHGVQTADLDTSEAQPGHTDPPGTCLHDDACAGGGALNLGSHTIGVIPETVGVPALPASISVDQEPSGVPPAPTLADPKRPPRLA